MIRKEYDDLCGLPRRGNLNRDHSEIGLSWLQMVGNPKNEIPFLGVVQSSVPGSPDRGDHRNSGGDVAAYCSSKIRVWVTRRAFPVGQPWSVTSPAFSVRYSKSKVSPIATR
jgi:hypothetical protein